MRGNRVPVSVARKEYHVTPVQFAERQGARRIAEGCAHHLAVRDFKIGELGQTGPTYDAEQCFSPQDFNA